MFQKHYVRLLKIQRKHKHALYISTMIQHISQLSIHTFNHDSNVMAIVITVIQDAMGNVAVPSSPAALLVVALHRFWHR
jgi:hypothetical protein